MKKMFTICMAITLMLCIGGLSAQVERAIITPKEKPLTFVSAVKPAVPIIRGTIFDDVEGHTAFAMNSPGDVPWSYYVGNPNDTWGIQNVTFENVGEPGVTVFKPSATNPAVTYPPKSGLQFFAFFNVANSVGGPTNTWIISPMFTIEGSATISFWARALTAQYGKERFKVLTSSTGSAHTDFTNVISPGDYVETDATNWAEFTYNIPADAKYVAIACVSDDIFALFIDDITISGVSGPAPCDEITNLQAEIQGTDAKLTWTAAPGSPTGYKVYNGSVPLATVTNTQYMVANLAAGTHTLGVEAIYADDCEPVKVTTTVDIPVPLNPVKNLEGACNDGTITLTWEEPDSNAPGEPWLTYSADNIDPQSGIGLQNGGTIMAAARFTPADLAEMGVLAGSKITKMQIAITKGTASGLGLRIWEGGTSVTSPGTLVVQQAVDIATVNDGAWTTIDLTTPFTIDVTKELRIGYTITHIAGEFPVLYDSGPRVPNKSDLLFAGGWVTAYDALQTKPDKNTCVKVYIEGDAITPPEVVRYDIYRDDVKQGETTATTYTQTGMTDLYNYCIVAVYDNDAQSKKVCKTVSCAPCAAPTNLTVQQYSADCKFATLAWEAPAGTPPLSYNIYLDDNTTPIANVTTLTHSATGYDINETQLWKVTAVCIGGKESEPATKTDKCNVGIKDPAKTTFSIVPNPATNNITITAINNFHTIEVISFLGQTVLAQSNAVNTATLDVSNLTQGVYFVRIVSENGATVQKFVKQ